MPSLCLPSGENEREERLSLFKMHKAKHPTVTQLHHHHHHHRKPQAQGKSPGSSWERTILIHDKDSWLYYCTPSSQIHIEASLFTRIIFSALKISALGLFFHHYHLNQHIRCHERPKRICKRARSRAFPKLVYHGMSDYSVLPFALCSPPSIPLPHPEVAFVLAHTPLYTLHTLSVPREPFSSPPPCLRITLLRRHNAASLSLQAFSACRPVFFKKGSVLTNHKKGKS